jgi:hypothetical protein
MKLSNKKNFVKANKSSWIKTILRRLKYVLIASSQLPSNQLVEWVLEATCIHMKQSTQTSALFVQTGIREDKLGTRKCNNKKAERMSIVFGLNIF